MNIARLLAISSFLFCGAYQAYAYDIADFERVLADVRPGASYGARPYLECTGNEDPCQSLEGTLGKVKIRVELAAGTITRFLAVEEGVRIEQELLPTLRTLYGAEEKRHEGFREQSKRPDQALTIAAARYVSYEWQSHGVRIVLFSQEPFRVVHDDGRTETTEPMKTYVSGELAPPR